MSASADRIDSIIRAGLAPALKQAGYRKAGRTWRQADAACVRLTNAQGSWTNSSDVGRFTLNLAVYFPAVDVLWNGPPPRPRPTEADCLVRQRIGALLPGGQDHWWEVSAATDLTALGAELGRVWQEAAAPWLAAHSAPAVAQAFLLARGYRAQAAAFSLWRGEVAEARRLWGEALAEAQRSPHLVASLRTWGHRHGLTEDPAA